MSLKVTIIPRTINEDLPHHFQFKTLWLHTTIISSHKNAKVLSHQPKNNERMLK